MTLRYVRFGRRFQVGRVAIAGHALVTLLILWSGFVLSCDKTTGPGYKESPFVSLFYWGSVEYQVDLVPNKGIPISFVTLPVWTSGGTVLAYSQTMLDKHVRTGVFEISFNPDTYEFLSVRPFDAGAISSLDYDQATGTLLVARIDRDGNRDLVRGVLGDGVLAVEDTVAGIDENVLSGRFFGGHDSIIYYAAPESDPGQAGFYYTDGEVDSLMIAAPILVTDARTFAVDASQHRLVYGATSEVGVDRTFEVHVVDTESMSDSTVLAGEGVFRGAAISSSSAHKIVVMWSDDAYYEDSYFRFFDSDLTPGGTESARAGRCAGCAVQSAMPAFSPGGKDVVFSSQWFFQEGGGVPWGLWVYKR